METETDIEIVLPEEPGQEIVNTKRVRGPVQADEEHVCNINEKFVEDVSENSRINCWSLDYFYCCMDGYFIGFCRG